MTRFNICLPARKSHPWWKPVTWRRHGRRGALEFLVDVGLLALCAVVFSNKCPQAEACCVRPPRKAAHTQMHELWQLGFCVGSPGRAPARCLLFLWSLGWDWVCPSTRERESSALQIVLCLCLWEIYRVFYFGFAVWYHHCSLWYLHYDLPVRFGSWLSFQDV